MEAERSARAEREHFIQSAVAAHRRRVSQSQIRMANMGYRLFNTIHKARATRQKAARLAEHEARHGASAIRALVGPPLEGEDVGRRKLRRRWSGLVWAKSGGLCWYCGLEANTIDHVVPLKRKHREAHEFEALKAVANLVPACRVCNGRKKSHSLDEFRELIARGRGLDPAEPVFAFEVNGWVQ